MTFFTFNRNCFFFLKSSWARTFRKTLINSICSIWWSPKPFIKLNFVPSKTLCFYHAKFALSGVRDQWICACIAYFTLIVLKYFSWNALSKVKRNKVAFYWANLSKIKHCFIFKVLKIILCKAKLLDFCFSLFKFLSTYSKILNSWYLNRQYWAIVNWNCLIEMVF